MKRKKSLIIFFVVALLLTGILIVNKRYNDYHYQKAVELSKMTNRIGGAAGLGASVTYTDVKGIYTDTKGTSTVAARFLLGQMVANRTIFANNPPIINSIHYDTTEAILNINGFLYTEKNTYPTLTVEGVCRIMENNLKGTGWKPLDPKLCGGLNADDQESVYYACINYCGTPEGKQNTDYIAKLNAFYTDLSTGVSGKTNQQVLQEKYGDKYGTLNNDVGKLQPEVLQTLIDTRGY